MVPRLLLLCVLALLSTRGAEESGSEPTPTRTAAPGDTGYWLSAELLGPASARARAVERLRTTLDDTAPPPSGADGPESRASAGSAPNAASVTARESTPSEPWVTAREPTPGVDPTDSAPTGAPVGLTGAAVAHVPDIRTALRWVEQHAFAPPAPREAIDPLPLRLDAAAVPGGPLRTELGVQLRSLAVSGQTPTGERRSVDWPTDPHRVLPPDSTWLPAELLPNAAPIFAAPAPVVPPASERFATIDGRGQLFVVAMLDRCRGDAQQRRCLRWAQVVARNEDRFIPGYVPAFQVAVQGDWVGEDVTAPRLVLLRSGVDGSHAQFLLLARVGKETLHRSTVTAAMNGDAFPDASLGFEDGWATVIARGEPARRIPLTAEAADPTRPRGADAADPPATDAPSPARSAEQ
jgi:hypothetical protein